MRYAFPILLLCCACDDAGPSVEPPTDASPMDQHIADASPVDAQPLDSTVDSPVPDAAPIDASPLDAMPDAMPDMMPDAYIPQPPDPPVMGMGERLGDQSTEPGGRVTWPLDTARDRERGLQVRARIWRWEDGLVQVQIDDAPPVPGIILSDADSPWRLLRHRAGAPPNGLPPPIAISSQARSVSVIAEGGPLALGEGRLADLRGEEPAVEGTISEPDHTIAVMPCGADCDDGLALTQALIDAPAEGILRVELTGRYTLRTPWRVTRDRVQIVGDDATLFWDPDAPGHRAAVQVNGAGPVGGRLAVDGAVESGQRRFVVTAPPEWQPRWVRIVADDFGHIPRNCINGRDQEAYQRHLSQLVRVLSISPAEEGQVAVVVDRPLFLDVPAEANPGIQAVELRQGVHLQDLHVLTNCPEALDTTRFNQAACTNPGVIEDDGIAFTWTDDARATRVSAQGTGKFAISVTHALETRVIDCVMDHPSDYGEGGKGYGVHLITASRSVVRGSRVTQARHGVVVDFGSSDSQVLDGDFSVMNQAFIDVHGEASRDTLIRGNTLHDGPLGVIVGGGGNVAHCNDGPRHHVHQNTATGISNSAVTVFDETREVFVRQNDLDATLFGAVVAFEAEALLEGNIIRRARVGVQAADGGRVTVRGNVFTDACNEAAASLNARGEIIFEGDNQFCP